MREVDLGAKQIPSSACDRSGCHSSAGCCRRAAAGGNQSGSEGDLEQRAAIAAGETFVVETTLSGGSALRLMALAKAEGYRLELHFVCVNSADEALDRVASRVAQGGHDVAEEDVRRRFERAQQNLVTAIEVSDESRLYDNASGDEPYRSVAVLTATDCWFAAEPPQWVSRVRDRNS